MKNELQQHFPMIRSREEIHREIMERRELSGIFALWRTEQQEEFLDFCSGARGVKILYDSFFKEILNPEYNPERLNELLSLLLDLQVKIVSVLPLDSVRIGDESSLLIMDIVVEAEDGSILNIEVQKIGYRFPGQRSACYSADLLLRQYKRIRDEKKKQFNYRALKTVYTIVFFKQSPKEFKNFPEEYLHYFCQKSNTGLELELLQKYLFIPLDIFRETLHNKNVTTKRDAWLKFLSADRPEDILELIEKWPQFREMYEQIYNICANTEKVMGMFSEELRILDRNTVQYMIDELQEELERERSEKEQAQEKQKHSEKEKELLQEQQKESQIQAQVWKLFAKGFSQTEIAERLELPEEKIGAILEE